jgi:hypothetical protein
MDISLLQSKLKELKSQSGERRILWKPKPGKQVVRIVPYKHNPNWPFVELYFHYNIASKTMISPSSFGKRDPIKEFSEKLQSTGDRDDWKHGKRIEPKRRTYVPILVRGEESEGVKFWGFGTQIYEQLLMKIDDPDWGDITHPMEGRDITVMFEKASGPNSYPKTTIDVKPNQTVVTENREVLESMKDMPELPTLWDEPSYEELKAILDEYVETGETVQGNTGASTNAETDTATTEAVATGTKPVSTENSTSTKSDVMEAFGSYFDKKGS